VPNVAGQTIRAGLMSGEVIAVDTVTSNSSTFTTTETTVQSVTASLIDTVVYDVYAYTHFNADAVVTEMTARLREDNSTGTELWNSYTGAINFLTTSALGNWFVLAGSYTASSTGSKTFVLTGLRTGGAGNCKLVAASNRPSKLLVVRR